MDKLWPKKFWEKLQFPRQGNIYIIPTRIGLYHLGGSFLGIILTLSYANPLGIFFMFNWFCFLLGSAIATQRTLKNFAESLPLLENCWNENETPPLRPSYYNEFWSFDLLIEHPTKVKTLPLSLGPLNEVAISPGCYRSSFIRISSMAPFGLFKTWTTRATSTIEIVIYPEAKNYGVTIPTSGLERDKHFMHAQFVPYAERSLPDGPIQLEQLDVSKRIHWNKTAQGLGIIGVQTISEESSKDFILLEKIPLQDPIEKARMALYSLTTKPNLYGGIILPNGSKLAGLKKIKSFLAHYCTEKSVGTAQ